jgi:hypothetical protein
VPQFVEERNDISCITCPIFDSGGILHTQHSLHNSANEGKNTWVSFDTWCPSPRLQIAFRSFGGSRTCRAEESDDLTKDI